MMDIKRSAKAVNVTFFFRKPRPQYHSIERVFGLIMCHLPDEVVPSTYWLKSGDTGIFSRLKALLEVWRNRNQINHITGDISFVTLALPRNGLVVTFHDLESLERGNMILNRLLKLFWVVLPARRAQVITVISRHTKELVAQWAGVEHDKIVVIPNPLPHGFEFQPKEEMPNVPLILTVGTKPNKNLEGIVNAVQQLKCRLLIVGRMSVQQVALLKEREVDYENLTGATDAQIVDAYRRCDLLCFPSFFEGFGMPIIEAQATGRPVITSNYGAMKEVAGEGALLVDPHDVNAIRSAIREVIDVPQTRNRLITAGLHNVKTHDPKEIAMRYTDIYRAL